MVFSVPRPLRWPRDRARAPRSCECLFVWGVVLVFIGVCDPSGPLLFPSALQAPGTSIFFYQNASFITGGHIVASSISYIEYCSAYRISCVRTRCGFTAPAALLAVSGAAACSIAHTNSPARTTHHYLATLPVRSQVVTRVVALGARSALTARHGASFFTC